MESSAIVQNKKIDRIKLPLVTARFFYQEINSAMKLETIKEALKPAVSKIVGTRMPITFCSEKEQLVACVLDDFLEARYASGNPLSQDITPVTSAIVRIYECLLSYSQLFTLAGRASLRYSAMIAELSEKDVNEAVNKPFADCIRNCPAFAGIGQKIPDLNAARMRMYFNFGERTRELDIGTHPNALDRVYVELGVTVTKSLDANELSELMNQEAEYLREIATPLNDKLLG